MGAACGIRDGTFVLKPKVLQGLDDAGRQDLLRKILENARRAVKKAYASIADHYKPGARLWEDFLRQVRHLD